MPDRPLIIAHRGDSAHAPENTLAAIMAAGVAGADWVEVDVQMTSDGHLICLHDLTLNRTTNAVECYPRRSSYQALGFTLDEIRGLDAGSWFSPGFAGERIPSLDAAVSVARESGMCLLIEVKDWPAYGKRAHEILDNLVHLLAGASFPDPGLPYGGAIVQSFYPDVLKRAAVVIPEIVRFQLAPAFSVFIPSIYPSVSAALDDVATYAPGVGIADEAATSDLIGQIGERGLATFVWTVNDPIRMRELVEMGVAGIITDDPGLAKPALAGGGGGTPPARA